VQTTGRIFKNQRQRRNRDGVVTVEFAMVAPVIFLMFFGALEIASLNFARHAIGFAAYESARKLTIPGGTVAIGQAEGLRQLNLVGLGKGVTIEMTDSPTSITCTVRIPSSGFSWGPVGFFANYTLKETCTLTKE
jgi:Flp pilus assembly protein TadG